MRSKVFPLESSLPARDRRLIGMGITVAHLLLLAWLLRVAGHGVLGAGDQLQGDDGVALSVTFVTLSPPAKPALAAPTRVPPAVEPNPENGTAIKTTHADQAAAKVLQVLVDTGERASSVPRLHEQVSTINQTAAASASSAAKGGSPGDDLRASYHAALRAAIRRKWTDLTDRPFPSGCALRMTLATGGALNATSANSCALSNEDRLQLEAAALMAQPLPYAGYEAVFAPELALAL
jgi:colicin import membrane protein